MPFQSSARIKRSAHVIRAQIVYGAYKSRETGVPGIQPEINKSSLHCQERANRTVASHNLGAKEPMQDSEIAGHKREAAGIARVRKTFGKSLFEIIIHLTFQHDVRERSEERRVGKEYRCWRLSYH